MTERERLIDLIVSADISLFGTDKPYAEVYADYLLANGVIVPMCEVGDAVYQTDGVKIYELEILDVSLRKNKPYYETESIGFDGGAIGETVFLTREEAEKALERSRG